MFPRPSVLRRFSEPFAASGATSLATTLTASGCRSLFGRSLSELARDEAFDLGTSRETRGRPRRVWQIDVAGDTGAPVW